MSLTEIREIISTGELESIREPWTSLLDDSHQSTVFGTWEWQFAAAKHLADADSIRVFIAHEGERLDGILPMMRKRIKVGGIIPVTALTCLGGGITDYNAMVVRKGRLSKVMPAIASHLERTGMPVMLENVLPGSPLDILARYLRRQHFGRADYESKVALNTRLCGDYERFLKSRKKKFRGALNNNRSYMNRNGEYSYHTEAATSMVLKELIKLHAARWESKGESGALSQDRIISFHNDLHELAGNAFSIHYYTIRHGRKPVAISYGFLFRNRFYFYQSGIDMEHGRISPGNMVIDYCIQQLFQEGVAVFDMLRGDMKYKRSWATAAYDMTDVILFPPDIAGRFLHGNMKAIQTLKRAVPSGVKEKMKSVIVRDSK